MVPGDASRDLNLQVAQTELLQCLEQGLVQVFYQPKINVKNTLRANAISTIVAPFFRRVLQTAMCNASC